MCRWCSASIMEGGALRCARYNFRITEPVRCANFEREPGADDDKGVA